MSKHLLIYQTAVPLLVARHANLFLEPVVDYGFSAEINAVPLLAVEFPNATSEYAIVFAKAEERFVPVVALGIRNCENLYLSADRGWLARYVPAFIRRYPFVFAGSENAGELTLCIDEAHLGFNHSGSGERVFGPDGKPTAYLERVLTFMREYQVQFERTRLFAHRVAKLGLLEPMELTAADGAGRKQLLTGFFGVNRDRLRALDGDALKTLAQTDELELLYLHLNSLRNFSALKNRPLGSLN